MILIARELKSTYRLLYREFWVIQFTNKSNHETTFQRNYLLNQLLNLDIK